MKGLDLLGRDGDTGHDEVISAIEHKISRLIDEPCREGQSYVTIVCSMCATRKGQGKLLLMIEVGLAGS